MLYSHILYTSSAQHEVLPVPQLHFYPCCRALPPASSTPVIPPCPPCVPLHPTGNTGVWPLNCAKSSNRWTKSSKWLKHLGAVRVMPGHSPSVGSSRVSFWFWQKLQEFSISEILSLTSFAKFDWADAADGKGEGQVEGRKEGEIWAKTDRQSCHIIFVLTEQQTTTASQLWKHYVLRCCAVFGLSSPFQVLPKMNTQRRDRSLSHTAGWEEKPFRNRTYVCSSIHPASILAVLEQDAKTSGS